MDTYRVHMWLYFTPYASAGDPAFKQRFTDLLRLQWWNLSLEVSSLGELANKLNARIKKDCQSYLDSDSGLSVTAVLAFDATLWAIGSGGQHEDVRPVRVTDGTTEADWIIKDTSYQMFAKIFFYQES